MKAQIMNIIKMLSKTASQRMPFEGVQLTKFLQRIPFFKRMFNTQSQKFITLCLSASLMCFECNQNLFNHEIFPEFIYVILEGSVRVESQSTRITRHVQTYEVIGNVQVVFQMSQRSENATTESEVTCMVLKAEPLLKILRERQQIQKAYHYLQINQYFSNLSSYDKKSLTLLMKKESFSKFGTISYEGSKNTKVYFIIHGSISIVKKIQIDGEEKEAQLDTICEMDSYGEYQCIYGLPSQVSLIAGSTGSYYSIQIKEVKQKKHPILECVSKQAYPYPDKEQIQFRYKIEAEVEKQKNKIAKRLHLN